VVEEYGITRAVACLVQELDKEEMFGMVEELALGVTGG